MKITGIAKILAFPVLAASLFFGTGCAVGLDSNASGGEVEYGTLTIGDDSRALNINDISYARAYVTGTGIASPVVSDFSTVENGAGSATVEKIPVGKNRIVTVYSYDSSKNKMGTVMLRAVTDINRGENYVNVTKDTTLLGNVFDALLSSGVNLADVDVTAVQSKLSSATESWALYDASAIAADYVTSGSAAGIKALSNYKLSTGSVTFTNYYDGCTIQVGDPVSSIKTSVSAGEGSLSGIAPGIWPVYVTNGDELIKKTFVTVSSGADSNIGYLGTVTDRIIVHYPVSGGFTNIYAWVSESEKLFGVWPGTAMTDSDGDGWYDVEISRTDCNLIFNNGNGGQTGNLSRETGEWWYKNDSWYDEDPDDKVMPELISFTSDKSGTVSGDVIFTIEASDNLGLATAVIMLDDTTVLKNISLSGKSSEVTYTWETAYLKNGTYKVSCHIKDSCGNVSESKALTFNTSNANLPPVAIISGPKKMAPGKSVTYKALDSYDQNGGTIKSYQWTVTGTTVTSSLTGSTVTVTAPDTVGASFKVSLVVKDDQGASSSSVSLNCETMNVDANWDFRDETIYFLMTTRFYDGDSSNNRYCWGDQQFLWSEDHNDPGWRGDFKGLIEKLDYIKALGFTAIWITPVVENASDLDYHGYHATDFSKVDPRYESAGVTYQTLIDACHDKGLKVIQDIVLNHCSNAGERNILPMTVKDYDADVRVYNGVKYSVPMVPDHNVTDIYGRNTYELLNKGVKALTGGKYNTYEELEADANHYYNDETRGSLMYNSRIYSMNNGLDVDNDEVGKLFHYCPGFSQWESYEVQVGTMAGDCVDLNTENPKVAEYLRNCYINYIQMGVDAFRIDTLKHISRLTMNNEFIPQFHEAAKNAGNDKFFMFGEACVKRCDIFNADLPGISVCFYTWNQNKTTLDSSYPWKGVSDYIAGAKDNLAQCKVHFNAQSVSNQLTSDNAFLNGVTYHSPDYSKYSGLSVIDFRMHHQFLNANQAYSCCIEEDQYFNDSTWNVTYVDSHDYGPNTILGVRYDQGTDAWAENLDLMFTFRGIPCIYYGSEIEFQKGEQIEPWYNGNRVPYNKSGRAYFGDHLEGSVTANDTGDYTASGAIKETLDSTLSQHIMRLNQIRAAVPALRKGQYKSYGDMKFVRRYTSNEIDSVAVVSISGSASFSGLPAGTYIDVVSGDKQTIGEGGTITTKNSGKASMAVYVNATLDPSITGVIGEAGTYLK